MEIENSWPKKNATEKPFRSTLGSLYNPASQPTSGFLVIYANKPILQPIGLGPLSHPVVSRPVSLLSLYVNPLSEGTTFCRLPPSPSSFSSQVLSPIPSCALSSPSVEHVLIVSLVCSRGVLDQWIHFREMLGSRMGIASTHQLMYYNLVYYC